MGGKALKNVETKRVDRGAFDKISKAVIWGISDVVDYGTVIPAYATKETFGDADILVVPKPGIDLRREIETRFSPTEMFVNGKIISFDYEDFQIDIISSNEEEFRFSLGYFAYNDLGNFIGRTAHRLGFKFGHDGLWYSYRDPENKDRMFREILITQDFNKALMFLGFDPFRHRKGFDTPGDIFAYAASSKFFDPAQFLLHNRSYAARKRDSTRKMYSEMLQWIIENYPELPADAKPTPVDRCEHLQRAFRVFTGFEERFREAERDLGDLKAFKAVFNGELYREWFDVEGKELGMLMERHRRYIEKHSLRDWIASLTIDQYRELADFIEKVA